MRGDNDEALGRAADRLPLDRLPADRLPADRVGRREGWVPDQSSAAAPHDTSTVSRGSSPPAMSAAGAADPPVGGPVRRLPLWSQPWLQPAAGRQLGWLAAVVVVVLAVSGWLLLHRPAASAPVPTSGAAPPPAAAAPAVRIVVDVGGRVRHPGLVTLPLGARVADALRAAGGALRAADIATLDLAARVADGQLLLIGVPGAGLGNGLGGGGGGPSPPVSLGSATVDQLDALPGVGPVLARHIVDWRDAHGGFTSLAQLQQVAGIGPRTYERLKALVTL
jgi:competence protein ComEA